MPANKTFGGTGEDIARKYLIEKGYFFIESNFSTRLGEIDLVMRDGKELVFVEVKTRRTLTYGYPEEAITKRKLERIKKALYEYRSTHPQYKKLHPRIDAIAILYEDTQFHNSISPEITHLINIEHT